MNIVNDKLLHYIVGIWIQLIFSKFININVGLIMVIAIGIGKEIYDKKHPDKHTADLYDVIATVLGGITVYLFY